MRKTLFTRYIIYSGAVLMCFLTLLIASGNAIAKDVGYFSVGLLLVILAMLPFLETHKLWLIKYDAPLIYFLMYFLLVLIGAVNTDINGLIFAFDVLIYLSLYMLLINVPDQYVFRNVIGLFLKVFIIVCVLYYFLVPEPGKFSFFFSNPNVLGVFVLISSFFIFNENNKFNVSEMVWFFAIGFIVYVSMSRSAFGGYLIILLCLVSKSILLRMNLRLIYLVCMALFLSGCYLYVSIKGTDFGDEITIMSRLYLEKNLYSGRQEIWASILESMSGLEYLIGKGSGVNLAPIIGRELSAHNSYIQILSQSGIIGVLFVLGWFCFSIHGRNRVPEKQRIVKFAWILAISFSALWEVFIFQNHPELSIFMILVVALTSPSIRHLKGRRTQEKWTTPSLTQ